MFVGLKAARKRAGKAVPVAAIAATLATGVAIYGLTPSGGTHRGSSAHPETLTAAVASDSTGGNLVMAGKPAVQPLWDMRASVVGAGFIDGISSSTGQSRQALASLAASAASAKAAPAKAASAKTASVVKHAAPVARPLACNTGSGGLLPANVTTIVTFLLNHGYSRNAAAGIAGNIYRESQGNPESVGTGGGGLIGWTPLPSGLLTGNYAVDLNTQLNAILTFNQQWSQYLPALNSAPTPAAAADVYVTDFERAGIPAASMREQAAQDVASACGL